MHVVDVASKNEILKPLKTDAQTSILQSTKNEMLDHVQTIITVKYIYLPIHCSKFQSAVTLSHENDQTKILHVNGAIAENKMLEPVQTEGHGEISPSTFQSSHPDLKNYSL